MNNVIDEVLAGEPRYNIKDNGGTAIYSNVQIELATTVTTVGTPLNKALFDSIQADLNTRLLVSNKAEQSDMWTGTDDTKYVTPLKVQQKLNSLTASDTQSTAGTYTVCTFTNFTNVKKITISGKVNSNSNGYNFVMNGSSVRGYSTSGTVSGGASLTLDGSTNSNDQAFEFVFDLNSKSFAGMYVAKTLNHTEIFCGTFSSLTNFQIKLLAGTSYTATIQYSN